MPDLITYMLVPHSIDIDDDAILGPCPQCSKTNVVMHPDGCGHCDACETSFTVEFIVRLAVIR